MFSWAKSLWKILCFFLWPLPDPQPEPDNFWSELHAEFKRQTDEWDQEFFRQTGKGVGALDPMLREQKAPRLVQGAFNTVLAPGLYQSLLGAQPANAQQQALMQGALANQRQLSYEQMLQAPQQHIQFNGCQFNNQVPGINFPLGIFGNPWRQ